MLKLSLDTREESAVFKAVYLRIKDIKRGLELGQYEGIMDLMAKEGLDVISVMKKLYQDKQLPPDLSECETLFKRWLITEVIK